MDSRQFIFLFLKKQNREVRRRAEGAELHAPGATQTHSSSCFEKTFPKQKSSICAPLIAQKHPAPRSGCCHSQVNHGTVTTSTIHHRHCNHPITESDPHRDHSAPFCWDFHCSGGYMSLIAVARDFPELLSDTAVTGTSRQVRLHRKPSPVSTHSSRAMKSGFSGLPITR